MLFPLPFNMNIINVGVLVYHGVLVCHGVVLVFMPGLMLQHFCCVGCSEWDYSLPLGEYWSVCCAMGKI